LWRQEKPVFSRGSGICGKFNTFVNNNPVIARLCGALWGTCGVVPKAGKRPPLPGGLLLFGFNGEGFNVAFRGNQQSA
jgi:hypothetical protein